MTTRAAPMPLAVAVSALFPHGGVTKSTLLAAIRKGDLAYEKIGKAYFVTEADIAAWRNRCRADACLPGSTTAPRHEHLGRGRPHRNVGQDD